MIPCGEPVLCTCGQPWHAIIPPPPCPLHGSATGPSETPPTWPAHTLGWECPRCHVVHAPSVPSCGCVPTDHPPASSGTGGA